MPCADYIDTDLQNAFFEGFTQGVEVTNLFVWNFYGELIHAAINYPGSWHDSKLAGASGLLGLLSWVTVRLSITRLLLRGKY